MLAHVDQCHGLDLVPVHVRGATEIAAGSAADCLACLGQGLFAEPSIADPVSLSRAGKRRNGLHAPRALAQHRLGLSDGARRRLPVHKSPGTLMGRRPSHSLLLKDGINLRLHTLDLTGASPGLGWGVEQEKPSID